MKAIGWTALGTGWLGFVICGVLLTPAHGQQAGERTLPADVDPVSRFRLPLPERESLDEAGKRTYDAFNSPDRQSLAGLQGPTGIRLHSPKLVTAMSSTNDYLRRRTGLEARLTELAILVTAREMDNQFEWTLHELAARKAGLEQTIIDLVKHRRPNTGLGEKETIIIRFGRELMGRRKVSAATFADAHRIFGTRMLVDLTQLMANYSATAALLTAFDMQLPLEMEPLLPLP